MATFNDILSANLIIDTNSSSTNTNVSPSNRNTLFHFDKTKPIENNTVPDEPNIYYLDNSKIYTLTKPLGTYSLKNHQLTTLHYMRGLEQMIYDVKCTIKQDQQLDATRDITTTHYTNVGILSDKVGAGKSYCIMGLINEAKSLSYKQLPFRDVKYGSNNIGLKEINKLDTNILMVPHSLVGQWKKYLENSGLKFITIQKARDIFQLADETKSKSARPKKDASTKATIDGNPSKTSKKKVNIIKRSKKEVDAIEALQQQTNDADKDISDKVEPSGNETKKDLENVKKQFMQESRNLSSQITDKTMQTYKISYASQERKDLDKQIQELKNQRNIVEKKIFEISNKIKVLDLASGNIKITEIHQLHTEFSSYYSNADYKLCFTEHLNTFLDNFGHLDKQKTEQQDVILVSATFYNLFALYLNRDNYIINRLIIDECNSVKGNRLVEIKRIFTWLITSSIKSIQTTSGYIQKLYTDPQYGYPRYTREKTVNSTGLILTMIKEIFENKDENAKIYLVNRPEYIEQSMSLPEMKTILVISKDNVNIQVLGGIVSHDVLQMLNAGDIDGIITKLDVAVGDETNVIEIITRKYQDELKVKEYELKVAIENPKYNPKQETIGVINKRTAIAELKKKIACIEERIKTVESCPICYDDFNNPAITPCCSNKFCFDCITMVLNSKSQCPLCKAELNIKNMFVISSRSKDDMLKSIDDAKQKQTNSKRKTIANTYEAKLELLKAEANNYGKYENMDKIFELNNSNTTKKYLIFTEYESTLNEKITNLLDKWGLTYGRIKGSGIMITNLVEQYKTGDTNALLINSKYFGSGMNLENTTDIIIIHKMQADVEMQVIGRAQRYGRVGNLRVWKLYYQNEANDA